jgi:hypothetical protein
MRDSFSARTALLSFWLPMDLKKASQRACSKRTNQVKKTKERKKGRIVVPERRIVFSNRTTIPRITRFIQKVKSKERINEKEMNNRERGIKREKRKLPVSTAARILRGERRR